MSGVPVMSTGLLPPGWPRDGARSAAGARHAVTTRLDERTALRAAGPRGNRRRAGAAIIALLAVLSGAVVSTAAAAQEDNTAGDSTTVPPQTPAAASSSASNNANPDTWGDRQLPTRALLPHHRTVARQLNAGPARRRGAIVAANSAASSSASNNANPTTPGATANCPACASSPPPPPSATGSPAPLLTCPPARCGSWPAPTRRRPRRVPAGRRILNAKPTTPGARGPPRAVLRRSPSGCSPPPPPSATGSPAGGVSRFTLTTPPPAAQSAGQSPTAHHNDEGEATAPDGSPPRRWRGAFVRAAHQRHHHLLGMERTPMGRRPRRPGSYSAVSAGRRAFVWAAHRRHHHLLGPQPLRDDGRAGRAVLRRHRRLLPFVRAASSTAPSPAGAPCQPLNGQL